MSDTLGADRPAGPLAAIEAERNRKHARLRPPPPPNSPGSSGLPDPGDGRITPVMLTDRSGAVARAPGSIESAGAPGPGVTMCESSEGTPSPINRVPQRGSTPEMVVSTLGDIAPKRDARETANFYAEMKELGFRSLEDIRVYLALSGERWPPLAEGEKVAKNDPRLRHEFRSGPWDPTWRWCWEQVVKFGYSVAPKRVESDVRFLLEVDI